MTKETNSNSKNSSSKIGSENASGVRVAEEIIERFGGIRPMAKKLSIPVTTIQGWKIRNAIPANRKAVIMHAARVHNIDLTDIVKGAPAPVAKENIQEDNIKTVAQVMSGDAATQEEGKEQSQTEQATQQVQGQVQSQAAPKNQAAQRPALKAPQHKSRIGDDDMPRGIMEEIDKPHHAHLLNEINQASKGAFKQSVLVTIGLLVVLTVVFAVILWPTKKDVAEYKDKVAKLQSEVKHVKKDHSIMKALIPDDIEQEFSNLKTQAHDLKQKVDNIAEQTASFAHLADTLLNPENGDLFARMATLEEKMGGVAGASDLSTLLRRVDGLQQSVEGQEQLQGSVSELNELFQKFSSKEESETEVLGEQTVEDAVELARLENEELGQTLAGVPQTDLKAAAYLVALTKFRGSLKRDETPFSEDLELLQNLIGEDDPELQAAIIRLAPKAADGVLSSQGLSDEFKGLTGDIVVSSLKGEDVGLKDKAKSRLNDFLSVKKDGELITGTETQAKVDQAQLLLEAGDVQGAIAVLNTLEGEAAETAQPFIQKAETTVEAQSLEEMLTGKLMENLQSGSFKFTPKMLEDLGGGDLGGFDVNSLGDAGKLLDGFDLKDMNLKNIPGTGSGNGSSGKKGHNFRDFSAKAKGLSQNLNTDGMVDGVKGAMPTRKLIQDKDSGFSIMSPNKDLNIPGVDALGLGGTLPGQGNKPVFLPQSGAKTSGAKTDAPAGDDTNVPMNAPVNAPVNVPVIEDAPETQTQEMQDTQ